MKHLGTKTLETKRLILRRFKSSDAQAMFNNWASDDEVTKYLTWSTHKSIEDSKAYLEMLVKQYEESTTYEWAIIKFLIEDVKVNRIEARHDTKNPSSGKVMEKCGLKYEGTLRESNINNQGIGDVSWYALLKKDYYGK